MREYLDLLRDIREHGTSKAPTRVEGGDLEPTIGLPNLHFSWRPTSTSCTSHSPDQSGTSGEFPLLTTRRLPFGQLVGELRSFLQGATHDDEFRANGCTFWTPWANNLSERGRVVLREAGGDVYESPRPGDLGPIYGAQWNAHGQLDHVLRCLRERPTDRRMVVSAWRPDEHEHMALPPCHVLFVVTVYDGKLYLSWHQRSCDFPIGVPYNIASYALLGYLLASWAGNGMTLGGIDCIFCDAHIYRSQLDVVDVQLARTPLTLPRVDIVWRDRDDFRSGWAAALYEYETHGRLEYPKVQV